MSKIYRSLILFGILLGLVAIYFVAKIPNSKIAPKASQPNTQVGKLAIKPLIPQPSSSSNDFSNIVPVSLAVTEPVISSRLLFMGDVFWGRSLNKWSQDSDLKYAYPFSGLQSFKRENYDAWIANLECPITSQVRSPTQQEADLKFTCLPDYLPEAKKYFDVFSQANNHTDNMQEFDGLASTRKFLEAANFQYFGSFDNHDIKDICEVISMPASATNTQNKVTKISLPVAMCGYNNVFSLPTKADIEVIQAYAKYFPTIIMPHQGQEYVNKADKYKVSTYRQMIDNGADLVVGAHPHAVQNTEVYKGKLIVYSVGNFIFDQLGNSIVNHGAALDLTIDIDQEDTQNSENLQKWLNLGDSCKKYKDDCLNQAKAENLEKPKFKLKYAIIASQNDKKITQKADDKIQAKILKLTNWETSMQQLGQK